MKPDTIFRDKIVKISIHHQTNDNFLSLRRNEVGFTLGSVWRNVMFDIKISTRSSRKKYKMLSNEEVGIRKTYMPVCLYAPVKG